MVPVVVVLRPNSSMMRKKNPRRYTETEEYKNLALFEPRYEKTDLMHMRKQRRRSASR